MTINHHPDTATLMSYAAGTLDEAFATVISAHLAACPACRRRLAALESVGGELLQSMAAAPLKPGSLDRALSKLDAADDQRRNVSTPLGASTMFTPLERLLGGELDTIAWKRVAPGVAKYAVPMPASAKGALTLLKIGSGIKVPDHGHNGMELTLVLKGSYRDELGQFGPGDIADLDEEVEHQPKVDSEEPCICIVATEAPTRFKGLLGRLFQPLLGL